MHAFAQSTAVLVALACHFAAARPQERQAAKGEQPKSVASLPALAVLVSAKNKTNNLGLNELRAYFKLTRKYWDGTRQPIKLLLPRYDTAAMDILLDQVYHKTEKELRSYLETKQFGGKINLAKFRSFVLNANQAIEQVKEDPDAITVVLVSELPADLEGVRVVSINERRPEDGGYSLVGKPGTQQRKDQPEGEGASKSASQ